MANKALLVSDKDLKELKKIGHGSDGTVYKYKKNRLSIIVKIIKKHV